MGMLAMYCYLEESVYQVVPSRSCGLVMLLLLLLLLLLVPRCSPIRSP